jgi:hypothetical protein
MSRLKLAGAPALVALMVSLAAPAVARDAGDYPAADDPKTLAAWLGDRTNIKPSAVVTITSGFVVALVGKTMPLSPDGPIRVTLREEVTAPAFIDAVGGRSSLMSLEIQCDERRLRMDERHLYAGPNLSGATEVVEPSTEWLRIPEESIMDDVARAACEANYRWPLRDLAPPAAALAAQTPPPPEVAIAPPAPAPAAFVQASVEPSPGAPETAPKPPAAAPETPTSPAVPAAEPAPVSPELAAESAAPAAPAVEHAEAPPGARYAIQIGAYRDEARAQAAWKALSTERPGLTQGHEFGVRPITVKGRDLLRGLVLNFQSPQEGAAFCTALAGTGYGCILRTLRD